MMNANPASFTLTNNAPMPSDTFVRVLDIVINRAGIRNIGSPQCELYVAEKDGSFILDFGGKDGIHKHFLTMAWAGLRSRKAIEARRNPVPVQFSVRVDNGYNCNAGVTDQVSYKVHAIACIQNLAKFISAFTLSLKQPAITAAMVNKALEEGSVYVLGNDIDSYGNVDARRFFSLFNRLGLFLVGQPVIRDYQSARVKAIEDKQKWWLDAQQKLTEEKTRVSIEQEKELTRALPRLIADLTAASVDPAEMQQAIEAITSQVRASTQRIEASLDARLEAAKQDYLRTITRVGNPELFKPTRQASAIGAGNAISGFLSDPRPTLYGQRRETPNVQMYAPEERREFVPYSGDYAHPTQKQKHRQNLNTAEPQYQPRVRQPFGPAQAEINDRGTKHLKCRDCGSIFDFTEGEQIFFEEHGWEAPPRCPTCRKARKLQQGQQHVIQPGPEAKTYHFGRIIA